MYLLVSALIELITAGPLSKGNAALKAAGLGLSRQIGVSIDSATNLVNHVKRSGSSLTKVPQFKSIKSAPASASDLTIANIASAS